MSLLIVIAVIMAAQLSVTTPAIANEAAMNQITISSEYLTEDSDADENGKAEEQEVFTTECLRNSSWEKLTEMAETPKSSGDDEAIRKLIIQLNCKRELLSYNMEYREAKVRLKCDTVEQYYDQFEKIDLVTKKYKQDCGMGLNMHSKSVVEALMEGEDFIDVHILSKNYDRLMKSPDKIGADGSVDRGATIWESAENEGSGKSKKLESEMSIRINGVAYLDENGEVTSSYYVKGTEENLEKHSDIEIGLKKKRMIHVCTYDGSDLGWVEPNKVYKIVNLFEW